MHAALFTGSVRNASALAGWVGWPRNSNGGELSGLAAGAVWTSWRGAV